MTPAPELIRADVAQTLESHGIAPHRALRAAVRLVRGLALDGQGNSDRDPCETLYNMRDRIAELLTERGLPEATAKAVAAQVIDWLRKHWGGRNLTRRWWGFVHGGLQASSLEIDGELFPVFSDPVKSIKGRELRAVVWSLCTPLYERGAGGDLPGICRLASDIAAMVEQDWATIYVPLGEGIDRLELYQEVFKKFSGLANIGDITALGVSQSTGYDIYKRFKAAKEKREQPELF